MVTRWNWTMKRLKVSQSYVFCFYHFLPSLKAYTPQKVLVIQILLQIFYNKSDYIPIISKIFQVTFLPLPPSFSLSTSISLSEQFFFFYIKELSSNLSSTQVRFIQALLYEMCSPCSHSTWKEDRTYCTKIRTWLLALNLWLREQINQNKLRTIVFLQMATNTQAHWVAFLDQTKQRLGKTSPSGSFYLNLLKCSPNHLGILFEMAFWPAAYLGSFLKWSSCFLVEKT